MSEKAADWLHHFPNGDMPTHIGIRRAMAEAVILFKDRDHSGEMDTAERVTLARQCLREAVQHDGVLAGAGTREVVDAYFQNVINNLNEPKQLLNFINGIQKSEAENALKSADMGNIPSLIGAAGAFSKSARVHLGMNTMTESFEEFLHSDNATLEKARIEPAGFAPAHIEWLKRQEWLLHAADRATPPAVMNDIPDINPRDYPQKHALVDKAMFVAAGITGGQEAHAISAPLTPKMATHSASQGIA